MITGELVVRDWVNVKGFRNERGQDGRVLGGGGGQSGPSINIQATDSAVF